MDNNYRNLFTPFSICGSQIKNRYYMAPMGTTTANDAAGAYLPAGIEYFVRRAAGGVGLIITGANWVDDKIECHSPGTFPCPTVSPGEYIKSARELTDRVHAFDTKIFVQLTAGLGRSAMPGMIHGKTFVAPSPVTNRWNPRINCRELTTEEVERIVEQFGVSAAICKRCGYDGVEVHAVHEGYLLDQFALALFNQRTDKYGGDLRGRLTFAIEIVQKIKKYCGADFPVVLRFSLKSYIKGIRQGALPGEDFTELGRDIEEGVEAAKILVEAGYDALDVDAGTYDSWYWSHPPMYFERGMYLPFAERLKKKVDVPILVAGRMDDPQLASDALEAGKCDLIGLARPLLADPDYVNKIRTGCASRIRPCLGCHESCFGRAFTGALGSCAVNPQSSREPFVKLTPAAVKKRVAVVGGGPGGMEAARVSALRGHEVVLLEASDRLGGAMKLAGVPDFTYLDREYVAWAASELEHLGVDMRLNTPATKELLDDFAPDTVFVATGSRPKTLAIPGAEGEHVFSAHKVLEDDSVVGDRAVVIGGGLIGCELALHLAMKGKKVSLLARREILKRAKLPPMNEFMLRDLLAYHGVEIRNGTSPTAIERDGVRVTTDGEEKFLPADTVILAVGEEPVRTLYEEIRNDYENVIAIGDCREVRNIQSAIWDAFEVARTL